MDKGFRNTEKAAPQASPEPVRAEPWWAGEGQDEPYFLGTVLNEPTVEFLKDVQIRECKGINEPARAEYLKPGCRDRIYIYRDHFIVTTEYGRGFHEYAVLNRSGEVLRYQREIAIDQSQSDAISAAVAFL